MSNGTTVDTLTITKLQSLDIYLPSLEEQRRVVERLDAAFEKIDRAIELTEKNIQYTRTLYYRLYTEILRNVIGEEQCLGDVCTIDSKLIDPRYEPYNECLHVGGANIEPETGQLINLKMAKEEKLISSKFPFDGTMVLYSKIRPYLKKVVRPDFSGLCSADIYPLLPTNEVRRDYLYYLLLSNDFTQYAISGSDRAGMPKVNRPHLFAYAFTLPSISDQDEIIKKLDDISAKLSSLIAKYQSKVSMLRTLKQSLLTQAFSQSECKISSNERSDYPAGADRPKIDRMRLGLECHDELANQRGLIESASFGGDVT
ncbi:restriction endonuclease subunit S [Candidatus Saccharibacteria bacterium]|nr:MAG: restriction endonuclease subunit S [Candidatus Saccharibacteria bacterium]